MPRDNMGLTSPYNDDRPFVLIPYDHSVQTGPNPVVKAVVIDIVEPEAVAEVEAVEAPVEAPAVQADAAYDFRVAPDAEEVAPEATEKPV